MFNSKRRQIRAVTRDVRDIRSECPDLGPDLQIWCSLYDDVLLSVSAPKNCLFAVILCIQKAIFAGMKIVQKMERSRSHPQKKARRKLMSNCKLKIRSSHKIRNEKDRSDPAVQARDEFSTEQEYINQCVKSIWRMGNARKNGNLHRRTGWSYVVPLELLPL